MNDLDALNLPERDPTPGLKLALKEALEQLVGPELVPGVELRRQPLGHDIDVVLGEEVLGTLDLEALLARAREFDRQLDARYVDFDRLVSDPDIPQASIRAAFAQGVAEIVAKYPPLPPGLTFHPAPKEIEVRSLGRPIGYVNVEQLKDLAREHAAKQN